MDRENVSRIQPRGQPSNGNGGGNGGLVNYRLSELERRMEKLEDVVSSINDICIQMNEKLDEKASKSYVLTIFALTGGVLILSFVGHVILRSLG